MFIGIFARVARSQNSGACIARRRHTQEELRGWTADLPSSPEVWHPLQHARVEESPEPSGGQVRSLRSPAIDPGPASRHHAQHDRRLSQLKPWDTCYNRPSPRIRGALHGGVASSDQHGRHDMRMPKNDSFPGMPEPECEVSDRHPQSRRHRAHSSGGRGVDRSWGGSGIRSPGVPSHTAYASSGTIAATTTV